MSPAPFQPPSTRDDVPEQMRRLWRKLQEFKRVKELPATATDAERNAKVNEIIRAIRGWVEG